MLIVRVILLKLVICLSVAKKYDPFATANQDDQVSYFNLHVLEELFRDWKDVKLNPNLKFFSTKPSDLLTDDGSTRRKHLVSRLSGELFLSNISIYGFEDKMWQYWSAPHTSPVMACVACDYAKDYQLARERYFGGFSARLRSLEAKLHSTIDGKAKECDVIALALKKDSISHQTVENKDHVTDDLNYFRMFFDFAVIWNPPIGIEIKNWTAVDDWIGVFNGSRNFLYEQDEEKLKSRHQTRHRSPLLHYYVDPKCLNITRDQSKDLNLALSDYLDYEITVLVADIMQSHFLINLGFPYARSRLERSGHPKEDWALDASVKRYSPLSSAVDTVSRRCDDARTLRHHITRGVQRQNGVCTLVDS